MISSGHPNAPQYTLAQVRYWLCAVEGDQRRRNHERLLILRASQATQDGFDAIEKALSDGR